MNVNNLKEGMILKNYKELCNVLDVKPTTGNGKINQLKELELYCNYHKEGRKIIIDKIFNNPTITINDLLKTRNSKYIKLIANIIVGYMYNNKADIFNNIPLLKFLEILGITNNNYSIVNRFKKEFSQLYDIKMASIFYFYSNTKNDFKRIVERCLNNLQSRSVLFWKKCIMIVDKNGNVYRADKETEKEILRTQKETLEYLGINNMYELMKDKKMFNEFNSIIEKELSYNYYFAYDVTTDDTCIKIEYNNIQNETALNKMIIDKTYNKFISDKYKQFYSDYEKLIDLLLYQGNEIKGLYDELKEQREYNIECYKKDKNALDNEYEYNNKLLKEKYFE